MTLIKGKVYREKTDSLQGYEDWEYTGVTRKTPSGELWYMFKNDRGYYHFDEKDLERFQEEL